MTSNFCKWEVDPFFSAAEEVQDSADRLESAYRTWVHEKCITDGVEDEGGILFYRRELSTALGTAKWQLEEFERAASRSTKDSKRYAQDDSQERHKQFVDAIKNQISGIEEALVNSNDTRDLKILPIVKLEPQERDDLALFLSGSTVLSIHPEGDNLPSFMVEGTEASSTFSGLVEGKSGASMESRSGLSKSSVSTSSSYTGAIHSRLSKTNTTSNPREIEKPGQCCVDTHFVASDVSHLCEERCKQAAKFAHGDCVLYLDGSMKSGSMECANQRSGHHGTNGHHGGETHLECGHNLDIADVYHKKQIEGPSSRQSLWSYLKKNSRPSELQMSRSGFKRWKDGYDKSRACTNVSCYCELLRNIEQPRGSSWFGGNGAYLIRCSTDCITNGFTELCISWDRVSNLFRSVQYRLSLGERVRRASGIFVALGLGGLLLFYVTTSHI